MVEISQKPTFAFMDETGHLHPNHPQRHFAVGAVIDSFPDDLIEGLHDKLQHLQRVLGKENDPKIEFRFSSVTRTSLPVYLELIKLLEDYQSWRFCCLVVDTEDSDYENPPDKPQEVWAEYLKFTTLLLRYNLRDYERAVLLADYSDQPTGNIKRLSDLPDWIENLEDTLKVESQGVLPVQIADVLLGGNLYKGTNIAKKEIAKKVEGLRSSIAISRFDRWDIDWSKAK